MATYLARSPNGLDNWHTLTTLQLYASQPQIWLNSWSDDILLVFEYAPPNCGNNHVIYQYTSLNALIQNDIYEKLNISRSLGA